MMEKDKLSMLEETLELDEGTLTPETKLNKLEEWDSIAVLSVIAMMDDEFGKDVKGSEIRALDTVADILKIMEK